MKKIWNMTDVEVARINDWHQEVFEEVLYLMLMHSKKTHKTVQIKYFWNFSTYVQYETKF